jgi:hypothetical protein
MTKFLLIFIALTLNTYGAEDKGPLTSPNIEKTFKQPQKTIQEPVNQEQLTSAINGTKNKQQSNSSISEVMIINPDTMANDWKMAFNMLVMQSLGRVIFHLTDGTDLINVSSLEPLQGGYLILFAIHGIHGKQYKIIKTADIVSISTE